MVLAAQRGDEKAFRDLCEAYRDRVWNLINSLIGDPVQAQDVLQNVFFKAFRALAGFRFQSCLFTWIYRIAHNECRKHLRKQATPILPLEAILGSSDEIDGMHVSDAQQARRAALRNAVMDLPFKMREVIVLKYIHGFCVTSQPVKESTRNLVYEAGMEYKKEFVQKCIHGTPLTQFSRRRAFLSNRRKILLPICRARNGTTGGCWTR